MDEAQQPRWHACYWILTAVITLVGCAPAEEPMRRGEVSLKFEHTSDSEVTFALTNGLDREIHIRGERTLFRAIRTWPPHASVPCQAGAPSRLTEELGGFHEPDLKFVDVSPGERVKLVVRTTLPQQSKGGRCWLKLPVKDGATIGPIEFRP